MSDLVEKLRAQAGISGYHSLMIPAADEIDRFKAENMALRALLKDLFFDIDDDDLVDWAQRALARIGN